MAESLFLSSNRFQRDRLPVLQTTSRQNHRAERIWPEVNSRINYPMKAVLLQMEADETIDMRNELHKFSVSWVTIKVSYFATKLFVESWNVHTIPGRAGGIPNL